MKIGQLLIKNSTIGTDSPEIAFVSSSNSDGTYVIKTAPPGVYTLPTLNNISKTFNNNTFDASESNLLNKYSKFSPITPGLSLFEFTQPGIIPTLNKSAVKDILDKSTRHSTSTSNDIAYASNIAGYYYNSDNDSYEIVFASPVIQNEIDPSYALNKEKISKSIIDNFFLSQPLVYKSFFSIPLKDISKFLTKEFAYNYSYFSNSDGNYNPNLYLTIDDKICNIDSFKTEKFKNSFYNESVANKSIYPLEILDLILSHYSYFKNNDSIAQIEPLLTTFFEFYDSQKRAIEFIDNLSFSPNLDKLSKLIIELLCAQVSLKLSDNYKKLYSKIQSNQLFLKSEIENSSYEDIYLAITVLNLRLRYFNRLSNKNDKDIVAHRKSLANKLYGLTLFAGLDVPYLEAEREARQTLEEIYKSDSFKSRFKKIKWNKTKFSDTKDDFYTKYNYSGNEEDEGDSSYEFKEYDDYKYNYEDEEEYEDDYEDEDEEEYEDDYKYNYEDEEEYEDEEDEDEDEEEYEAGSEYESASNDQNNQPSNKDNIKMSKFDLKLGDFVNLPLKNDFRANPSAPYSKGFIQTLSDLPQDLSANPVLGFEHLQLVGVDFYAADMANTIYYFEVPQHIVAQIQDQSRLFSFNEVKKALSKTDTVISNSLNQDAKFIAVHEKVLFKLGIPVSKDGSRDITAQSLLHQPYNFFDKNSFNIPPKKEVKNNVTASVVNATTVATLEDGLFNMLKADAKSSAYRIAAEQAKKLAKSAILSFIEKNNSKHLSAWGTLLETEFGDVFVYELLGYTLTYAPKIKDHWAVIELAKELRVSGLAAAGNVVASSMIKSILPSVGNIINNLPMLAEQNQVQPTSINEQELVVEKVSLNVQA